MSEEPDHKELSDIEIALMDAIKPILEALMHIHPGFEQYFARSFREQAIGKLGLSQPEAAAVFELLRNFVVDPERRKARQQLATILSEPPKGQA